MNPNDTLELDIARTLAQFLADVILADGSSIDFEQNLLADGVVDSLGMLRLVGFIEATYSIKISPADFTIANFRNITVISRHVSGLIDGPGG